VGKRARIDISVRIAPRLITISYVPYKKELVYHFDDGTNKKKKVKKGATNSLCDKFPNAELYEREIMEKFGVKFKGHPNPRELFLNE